MKMSSSILAAIIAAILAMMAVLLVGCGGSSSNLPSPPTVLGEYDKIGVTVRDDSTTPPTWSPAGMTNDATSNSWTATVNPPKSAITVAFYQRAIGNRGATGGKWDYTLFTSNVPQNYSDPAADMATFTHTITVLPATEPQHYTFWNSSRVLIRAYEPGTQNQVDATFLIIAFTTPEANVRTQMTVTDSVDANGNAEQTATISLTNLGLADANSVTLKLGSSSLPNTIEASTNWNWGQSVSGPVVISAGFTYQIGGSSTTAITALDGGTIHCSDSIITGGLPLGTLSAGKTILVYAAYKK